MNKPKHSIAWLTRRPPKFEAQRFERMCNLLSHLGYQVNWIEVPANLAAKEFQTWLGEKMAPKPSAFIFGDKEASWFRPLIQVIRTWENPEFKAIPIFWIYEDVDHHLLDGLFDAGFNDFFEESIRPHELLLRLRLRTNESEEREGKEDQVKEQEVRIARNETTVKQREEFLSVCAHDLRSPLGLIQSAVSMVLNAHSGKGSLAPTDYELLSRAKRQASHAISLVNDLLDVMSFEQGFQPQYQLLNLHNLLLEFYKDYRTKAEEKKVSFHYDNAVPNWRVMADGDRVQQMLQNLFMNALKFTESGKNIYLAVTSFQGRRKSDPAYPMIVITLRDEGKGIPPREMQRLFDRFSQIKNHSLPEGRGLGLTVAKQISLLHEGNIWVESAEGKGSTFWALFPHVISRAQPRTSEEKANSPFRILVVEPSDQKREIFFEQVKEWGAELHFARDGVDALAQLFHYLPDLVILTPRTQKLDVGEVVKIVKSDILTNTIPIVLAATEDEKIETSVDMHRYDRVIRMPFTRAQFETVLKSVGLASRLTATNPAKKAA
jgi:two-component system sensor histidine kinase/response regulator